MYKYNNRLKIYWEFSPTMQCITGQFFGWCIVLDAYFESSSNKLYNGKYFKYTGRNWKKLLAHINKMLKGSVNYEKC